jgi:hypothetical protein
MDANTRARLESAKVDASVMREFVQHPGYQILVREIQAQITDSKSKWLEAPNADEAEKIRLAAKPWGDVLNLIKAIMMRGMNAQRTEAYLDSQGSNQEREDK